MSRGFRQAEAARLLALSIVLLAPVLPARASDVDPELQAAIAASGGAPVRTIVLLYPAKASPRTTPGLSPAGGAPTAAARPDAVRELERRSRAAQAPLEPVLADLETAGDVERVHRHWLVPAVSIDATPSAIVRLAHDPAVSALILDRRQRVIPETESELDAAMNGGSIDAALRGDGAGQPAASVIPWGITAIRAPEVWNQLGMNGSGVLVAHLDSGVDYNHPDLASRIWLNTQEIAANGIDDDGNGYVDDIRGWDFALESADPMDDSGHGTHTAGTVVGTGTLGTATGVAPGATLMPLKVLSSGYGYESDAWEAIEYAITEGADIITMSLGWIQCYHHPNRTTWRTLAESVEAAGVLLVAAAGNEGDDRGMPWYCAPPSNIRSPGDAPTVLAVGATNTNGSVPSFSGIGPVTWSSVLGFSDYPLPTGLMKPDVAAPGVSTISTLPGSRYSTATWSGTSMSCPHVAGAAALMLDANPALTPFQIRQKLEQTAIDAGMPGQDNSSGFGRIDSYTAVLSAMDVSGTNVINPPVAPEQPADSAPRSVLYPAAPNPLRDSAELRFAVGEAGPVSLEIFDATGRLVSRLAQGMIAAGEHASHWDARALNGRPLPSGVYWARFSAGGKSEVQKLVLAR